MRNKSRKRILHEQRVELAKLRRELAAHKHAREFLNAAQEYEIKKVEVIQYIPPYMSAPPQAIEDARQRTEQQAIKKIIEALAHHSSEIIERIETEDSLGTKVRYRLTVLKRRY